MKKCIKLVVTLFVAVIFVACGQSSNSKQSKNSEENESLVSIDVNSLSDELIENVSIPGYKVNTAYAISAENPNSLVFECLMLYYANEDASYKKRLEELKPIDLKKFKEASIPDDYNLPFKVYVFGDNELDAFFIYCDYTNMDIDGGIFYSLHKSELEKKLPEFKESLNLKSKNETDLMAEVAIKLAASGKIPSYLATEEAVVEGEPIRLILEFRKE